MIRQQTRTTRQRQVILDELSLLCTHPTADQLYERVRERLPRVSLGTIYRNLEFLSDQGLIQRLELAGHQRRYDGRSEPHTHIRCSSCDCVADLALFAAQTPLAEVQRHTDFVVTGQRVEFVGVCPSCHQDEEEKTP